MILFTFFLSLYWINLILSGIVGSKARLASFFLLIKYPSLPPVFVGQWHCPGLLQYWYRGEGYIGIFFSSAATYFRPRL